MRTAIISPNWPLTDALVDHVNGCMEHLQARFDGRVRSIEVRLTDANGPKGGEDKVCRLRTKIDNHPSMNTESTHADLYAAIRQASRRMERALTPVLDATRTRKSRSCRLPEALGATSHLKEPTPRMAMTDELPWR